MNIKQLRDYLDELIDLGFNPETPLCVKGGSQASEIDDISIFFWPVFGRPRAEDVRIS